MAVPEIRPNFHPNLQPKIKIFVRILDPTYKGIITGPPLECINSLYFYLEMQVSLPASLHEVLFSLMFVGWGLVVEKLLAGALIV